MSLAEKLLKHSTLKSADILLDSKVFDRAPQVPTHIPMINVAMSGKVDGGISSGLLVLAGESKHFKSLFALMLAGAYLKKYPDAVMLFYDTEFGTPKSYFSSINIDMKRVIHVPIMDIEEMKHHIVNQLKIISKEDKVVIVVDSIGNMASKKEVDDATDGKVVVDMTRAKALRSLFRMVTPYLAIKDVPMFAVGHTYNTLEMFSKQVVSGGKGPYYAADDIWIIGRRQEKNSKGLVGYNFIINLEKSRTCKEKSKIPVQVTFDGGIQKWYGLLDVAVLTGFMVSTGKGKWSTIDQVTGVVSDDKYTTKSINVDGVFWKSMLSREDFRDAITKFYTLDGEGLMDDEENEE